MNQVAAQENIEGLVLPLSEALAASRRLVALTGAGISAESGIPTFRDGGGLWERFCANRAAPTCAACPLLRVCPVAALVAPMREDGETGGAQRPRPYTVRPPLGGGSCSICPPAILLLGRLVHVGFQRRVGRLELTLQLLLPALILAAGVHDHGPIRFAV